jgi:hypothetical protein
MPPPPPTPLVTYLALGFSAVLLATHRRILKQVETNARKRIARQAGESVDALIPEVGDLYGVYQSSRIIAAALLEGPAFFCLIAYLIEGQWISLVTAVILLIGLLLLFPSVSGVTRWIMDQQELIRQERSQRL